MTSLDTTEALKKLGFKPDGSVIADGGEGLSYNFGNLILSASRLVNLYFAEIIFVRGNCYDGRISAEIQIQLPLRVASIEQCAAFLAWEIDNQIGEDFVPLTPTEWLNDGRNNFDSLPWMKEQKLYAARPQCTVNRDWLKLALRDLRLLLPQLKADDLLSFTFQNEIFSIRSNVKTIALPAAGNDWNSTYQITAGNFQNFPKRLDRQEIEISIWENHLSLARWRYPIDKTTDAET